jgi:hypothetical protein
MEIKKDYINLRNKIEESAVGYILAAFGFVAGLAWNEAIKSSIELFFPLSGGGVFMKFIYAVSVTILLVFVTVYVIKPKIK